MTHSLFTQKHYEHVISELRHARSQSIEDRGITSDELDGATEFLARMFKRDNPKFKRDLFLNSVNLKSITA